MKAAHSVLRRLRTAGTLSILLYLVAFLWAFAARSLKRVRLVLMAALVQWVQV